MKCTPILRIEIKILIQWNGNKGIFVQKIGRKWLRSQPKWSVKNRVQVYCFLKKLKEKEV